MPGSLQHRGDRARGEALPAVGCGLRGLLSTRRNLERCVKGGGQHVDAGREERGRPFLGQRLIHRVQKRLNTTLHGGQRRVPGGPAGLGGHQRSGWPGHSHAARRGSLLQRPGQRACCGGEQIGLVRLCRDEAARERGVAGEERQSLQQQLCHREAAALRWRRQHRNAGLGGVQVGQHPRHALVLQESQSPEDAAGKALPHALLLLQELPPGHLLVAQARRVHGHVLPDDCDRDGRHLCGGLEQSRDSRAEEREPLPHAELPQVHQLDGSVVLHAALEVLRHRLPRRRWQPWQLGHGEPARDDGSRWQLPSTMLQPLKYLRAGRHHYV
mmetsp:Transcript_42775/g.108199  ORF Transcript_42775/g.108199 Transcript_42775/m.108199 type:complete len:328 (+) Transcript_42775:1719-2702(+)